jgi:ribosomal protein S18 acetylase RimI-like enzyme
LPRGRGPNFEMAKPTPGGALVVGWSGMRGIVTLAAALALPADFPYREFILLTAFVVVLGTLLIQGLTLRPLLKLVRLGKDDTVEREIGVARQTALKAALAEVEGGATPAAQRLSQEYQDALMWALDGEYPRDSPDNVLRRRMVAAARKAIEALRSSNSIGDDAYRRVEVELDFMELSTHPTEPETRCMAVSSGTTTGVAVRPATSADTPALGRLGALLVSLHHHFDPDRFIEAGSNTAFAYAAFLDGELKRSDVIMLVAEGAGAVLGYSYAGIEGNDYMALRGPAGVLYDLVVDPARRREGIGRMLLNATLAEFASRGAPRVVLSTAERNEAAQRLFVSVGFRVTMIEMTREL